jgi:very-short-patch-repair endonuclease
MTRLEFLEKTHNIHGYKYNYLDLPDKLRLSDKIKIEYNGTIYTQTISKHLMGRCPEKTTQSKTTEQFILEAIEVWRDKYDYSLVEYTGALNLVKIIYNGIVYEQRAKSHLEGSAPEFRKNEESILNDTLNKYDLEGEKEIISFLKKFKMKFEYKKSLDNVVFDFYIPSNRTLIEFDGLYHFEPVDTLGGLKTYNKMKVSDKIKNDYCEENYMNLIRIKYDQIDDIYQILWDSLKIYIKKPN